MATLQELIERAEKIPGIGTRIEEALQAYELFQCKRGRGENWIIREEQVVDIKAITCQRCDDDDAPTIKGRRICVHYLAGLFANQREIDGLNLLDLLLSEYKDKALKGERRFRMRVTIIYNTNFITVRSLHVPGEPIHEIAHHEAIRITDSEFTSRLAAQGCTIENKIKSGTLDDTYTIRIVGKGDEIPSTFTNQGIIRNAYNGYFTEREKERSKKDAWRV